VHRILLLPLRLRATREYHFAVNMAASPALMVRAKDKGLQLAKQQCYLLCTVIITEALGRIVPTILGRIFCPGTRRSL